MYSFKFFLYKFGQNRKEFICSALFARVFGGTEPVGMNEVEIHEKTTNDHPDAFEEASSASTETSSNDQPEESQPDESLLSISGN